MTTSLPVFLNVLIAGISIGAVYAMMAMGFSLLWQTSRTINFAQGDFATVSAFTLVGFGTILGLPVVVAAVLTVVFSTFLLGYVFRKTLISKLHSRGVLAVAVATLALAVLIQNAFLAFWTPLGLKPPTLIASSPIRMGEVVVNTRDVVNLLVAISMIGLLYAFLTFTKPGMALRATAQQPRLARSLGIDTERMITLTFAINAALVSVAAILLAPIFFVKYNMGLELGLSAFYAAIIGGFGRIHGALAGGIVVGVAGSLMGAYVSAGYRNGLVLLLAIAIIIWRPQGLFGKHEFVTEYNA